MKRNVLLSMLTLLAASLFAADSTPKDDVTAAAKKLGDQANYSWTTTVTVPEGSRFRPGPTDGQTEKDGVTHVTMSFRDTKMEAYLKGDKGAITNPDGGWDSLADMENEEGPGRFMVRRFRDYKAPAAEAADLVAGVKEVKKADDAYSGDMTEDAAKGLLSFRGRGGGDNGPTISGAKGSVKFWVKDGMLTKYEFKVEGKVEFNGNERDVDRTTTVEIKDVGSTKITVPDEAKKKLS